ncbi:PAS domain-containing protein [Mucilaginibacter sp.]|jgi:PAS domain S-box-containing protein|uniref:PAS domain-containing protein n=1 Tax=Mucilaginibacter sp. TaxID=1882438 RepID=UPI002BB78EA6|nr:PAS domain-containing protein [Mucilaginibacter sp.]HTI58926.1 PAS domain-containing protein [Mucilaginibacter sp.]
MSDSFYFRENRLEALIESGNDLIAILDVNGIYTYVAPSVKKVLNEDPEAFVGRSFTEFIHPEDFSRLTDAFRLILNGINELQLAPFRFLKKNGDWCWVETFATNKVEDPLIQGIVVNSRDITAKIKGEHEKAAMFEQLRLANERYDLVMKATHDVIWELDIQSNQRTGGKIFRKFYADYNYYNGNLERSWEDNIHPSDKLRVLKSLKAARSDPNAKFWRSNYRFMRTDQSIAYIIDQAYIARDNDKNAIRMVGVMHDNTNLKEKELSILEQNNRLREIAYITSHEIRGPVASILGLLNIFDKKALGNEENLEIFNLLCTATSALDDIIRKIVNKAG